jgi:hypothetical protein
LHLSVAQHAILLCKSYFVCPAPFGIVAQPPSVIVVKPRKSDLKSIIKRNFNPKVCGFPEACFGVSKRLQLSSSLGMEDAPQLAAGFFTEKGKKYARVANVNLINVKAAGAQYC